LFELGTFFLHGRAQLAIGHLAVAAIAAFADVELVAEVADVDHISLEASERVFGGIFFAPFVHLAVEESELQAVTSVHLFHDSALGADQSGKGGLAAVVD